MIEKDKKSMANSEESLTTEAQVEFLKAINGQGLTTEI